MSETEVLLLSLHPTISKHALYKLNTNACSTPASDWCNQKGGKKYVTLLIASVYTGKTIFEMSGTKKSMYQAKYHT